MLLGNVTWNSVAKHCTSDDTNGTAEGGRTQYALFGGKSSFPQPWQKTLELANVCGKQ